MGHTVTYPLDSECIPSWTEQCWRCGSSMRWVERTIYLAASEETAAKA
jgi:hypothetical protein